MKKIILFILIIFISKNVFSIEGRNIAYVIANSGLVLRDKASIKGNKILVLERNSPVEILDKSKNVEKIENKLSPWYKIRFHKSEGWVFGGFLVNFNNISTAYIDNRYDAPIYNNKIFRPEYTIIEIPYREKVQVLKEISLHSFGTYMIKIKWNDLEGWIHDMNLSFIEIPEYVPNYSKEDEPGYEKLRQKYYYTTESLFGKTIDEIIGNLGKPKKMNKEGQKNKYDESTIDYIYTLQYDGLEVTIYKVTYDNKEIITRFSFNSKNLVKNDKYLNFPISKVYKDFGIPHKDMNSYVFYYIGEAGYDAMSFDVKNGKVNRINILSFPE